MILWKVHGFGIFRSFSYVEGKEDVGLEGTFSPACQEGEGEGHSHKAW